MLKPDFIIIGAMKCATTTLHDQLAVQSGIFMSEPKEPNFFSDDQEYTKGLEYYHGLFSEALEGQLCGESSTHYTKMPTYPETVERIQKNLPEAKFIYVMRHPIDRLISQYIHEWSELKITGDINDAILDFKPLTQYSQYSVQIQPYLAAFGPDRVLPVFAENLRNHPQRELERVCQFIGYQGTPRWQENTGAQHVSTERMRKSWWRDLLVEQPVLRFFRRMLIPKLTRNWVRSLWQMKERPKLTPESWKYLEDIFDKDLKVLGEWLGITLNCETFKTTIDKGTPGFINWQGVSQ